MTRKGAQRAVDQVAEAIHPVLKARGFRRSRRCWNRSRSEFVDVIRLQESKVINAPYRRFTINLGVFVPSFHEVVWRERRRGFAVEADCAFWTRLSLLIQGEQFGGGHDTWWHVVDGKQNDAEIEEVQAALATVGVPFLDRFCNFALLAEHLQRVVDFQARNALSQMYRALAECRSGHVDMALETLSRIRGWEEKIQFVRDVVTSASK